MNSETIKALAEFTDEGRFEQLALALLHCAEPLCAGLSQQGVNAGGKTRASPVDNVGFVRGALPPHMVIVHHTIAAARELRAKWLGGLASGSRAAAPREGDIAKTARIVGAQRARQPDLEATLLLTSNQEPDEKLVRDIAAASAELGFEIDIWSRVRLARVLDTDPTGQWIRASQLGITQQWLSPELFAHLSRESIDEHVQPEAANQWIGRALDRQLDASHRIATFVVGASGSGKSVAALRALVRHLDSGGYALVIPHAIVENAPSLNAALLAALQRLRPALTGHVSPLSLSSVERPLLLLVEDINHASNPAAILDKLTRWSNDAAKDGAGTWRILCPMWQRTLSSAPDALRRSVEATALFPEPLTPWEASAALEAKAKELGIGLSQIEAHGLAAALGHDPLLIGLVELGTGAAPADVITNFVKRSIERCQALSGLPASELATAVRALAEQMLDKRIVAPSWPDVLSWDLSPANLACLRAIAAHGELLRLAGPSRSQEVTFRHDRVRDHLLSEAAIALFDAGRLEPALIKNPYFADVIAHVLIARLSHIDLCVRVQGHNPTALFQALRMELQRSGRADPLEALAAEWLNDPANRGPDKKEQRHHVAALLFECDGPGIAGLARLLPEATRHARLARLRNGDLEGGIEDCLSRSLYGIDIWRKRQIDHAKARHGDAMRLALATGLTDPATPGDRRGALLNLAGDLADPALSKAIQASWRLDRERSDRLGYYLWAASYCCTEASAPELLAPICDAWAQLPIEREGGMLSPRDDLVESSMRWGFERHPPGGALGYFADRGRSEDLNWPTYYMMHGIDHPVAIAFCLDAMAAAQAKSPDSYTFNFRRGADVWERRRDEHGEHMSSVNRALLRHWWQDCSEDKYRRIAAFDLWAASWAEDDLQQLRVFQEDAVLGDRVLRKRLERKDATAIPNFVDRLDGERAGYWWFFARYVLSAEVIAALDRALARIAAEGDADADSHIGWELANTLVRLPRAVAEPILLRHAHALSRSPRFVQCALYFASPKLLEYAARSIAAAAEPREMLKHITMHFGISERGHPGVTRPEQIKGLQPHLHLLDEPDLGWVAEACNKAGWFDLRRELFDPLIPGSRACWTVPRLPALFNQLAGDRHFIPHQVDEVIESGVSWPEIAGAMESWLSGREDLEALRLVGEMLDDRGHRNDLSLLERWPGTPSDASRAIIANATFAVCLRNP